MSASDTIDALEAGLITEAEAVEQAMVDTVDGLYEKAAAPSTKPPVRQDWAQAW